MLGRATSGDLAITVDGKVWRLVLDMNTLIDFQSVSGRDPFEFLDDLDAGKVDVAALRALFWAALQEHHPEVDLRAAGRLLGQAPDSMRKLLDASLPEADPDAEKPMPPKADAA